MVKIHIKDLSDSREMDREAMRAVTGGKVSARIIQPASPYKSSLMQTSFNSGVFSWATLSNIDLRGRDG